MDHQTLKPWLTILIHPRKTIRELITLGTNQRAIVILILLSIIVESFKKCHGPFDFPSIGFIFLVLVLVVVMLVLGVLVGLAFLNFCAALLDWTGKWLKGQGNYEEIKLALAWSNVPFIWSGLIWLVLFWVTMLKSNLINETVLTWLDYIIGIWVSVIFLNCLGEAQKFSVWKALLNTIIAVFVVVVPVAFLIGAGYLGYHYELGK